MEDIDRLARITVGRWCLYAVVGIAGVMAVLSYNPRVSFHVGGILALTLALLLVLKASTIESRPTTRRDILDFARDPGQMLEQHLRTLVTYALKEAYFSFASRACAIAGALLCVSLLLGLLL
ncbi:MAG: hypothetical protein B7X99_19030 [Rhizobiales bacterium 17-65-6]|nr:MAG: hypothetical protein B7Z30_00905 [Rhizobiales bacterium 12-68-15]OYX88969.1 MAG: hypothetical protein B7Y84_07110 [Azorhizobium sp. 32-67-21]OYZ89654.1 MAG: hypothetical protein B7X99_19030 [Rhizobiales bacterium 17-65-6]